MKPSFPLARELKKSYFVLGHFYNVELSVEETVSCRSVLEIFSTAVAVDEAKHNLPDAVFVMMNPGSSRPLSEAPIPTFKRYQDPVPLKSLVPARPDNTQYQVMRVVVYLGWSHVRVLNLSDIREAKSAVFAHKYKALGQHHGFTGHSIFSGGRAEELSSELQRKPAAPLVCAWGVSPSLDPLLRVAFPKLRAMGDCRGIKKVGTGDKYFHPLPILQTAKESWVKDACKCLGSAAIPS